MKKSLVLALSIVMAFASVFTTFAETVVNETEFKRFENGERPARPENEIIGRIKSISESQVTIEVATRKEMAKPQNNGQKGNPPEKQDGNFQNGNPPEKPNLDEMFTLTGETKTIDISQAEFNKNFRPQDKNTNAQGNNANNLEQVKQKTYTDYKVGDYIMIEATDSTYKTAKTIRDAGFGGGMRGMGGRNDKETPPNN